MDLALKDAQNVEFILNLQGQDVPAANYLRDQRKEIMLKLALLVPRLLLHELLPVTGSHNNLSMTTYKMHFKCYMVLSSRSRTTLCWKLGLLKYFQTKKVLK